MKSNCKASLSLNAEKVDFGEGPIDAQYDSVNNKRMKMKNIYGLSKVNGAWMYTVMDTFNEDDVKIQSLRVTKAVLR